MELSGAGMQLPTAVHQGKSEGRAQKRPGALNPLFGRQEHAFRVANVRCNLWNLSRRFSKVSGCDAMKKRRIFAYKTGPRRNQDRRPLLFPGDALQGILRQVWIQRFQKCQLRSSSVLQQTPGGLLALRLRLIRQGLSCRDAIAKRWVAVIRFGLSLAHLSLNPLLDLLRNRRSGQKLREASRNRG